MIFVKHCFSNIGTSGDFMGNWNFGQLKLWYNVYLPIKTLKFEKLTIPEFRAISGLLKYPKINFEKTFWTKKTIREYWAIFGLFRKVYIDFWVPTLNIKMHSCMAMVTRLWLKIIFLGILWSRNIFWFSGYSKMSISIFGAPTLNLTFDDRGCFFINDSCVSEMPENSP